MRLFPAILIAALLAGRGLQAAPLADPAVDAYNVRIGTQTFSGLYQFTTNTLLVETAEAIQAMGSDVLKFYLGPGSDGKSGVPIPPGTTNLTKLVRDEPSYRRVLDMPFRHYLAWIYPLSVNWAPFDGYSANERTKEYQEVYDLTRYLLTNYNNSGKTFYLGHWEGDGYLNVTINGKAWATNPTPTAVQGFIDCLNNRQLAIDDAKRDTVFTNVNVFCYAEANRARDAMLNGPTNNVRMINAVIPYVTNLDYVSYSSYDVQNLSQANLYATLDYIKAHTPTNKAAAIPGGRLLIGEYGWGGSQTPAQQEPTTRAYLQRLLNYGPGELRFMLFWEIYDNEGKDFYLISPDDEKTPCWDLHQRFINQAKLRVAQFKETNGRLPNDAEFAALASPLLNQPLPLPVDLSVANADAALLTNSSVRVSGQLTQGIYGGDGAAVWVYYGRQDGGTNYNRWENVRLVGVNTNFNPKTFSAVLNNLTPDTNYFFRFNAVNAGGSAWVPASATFSTRMLRASDFGARMKVTFSGYHRSGALTNFPALVMLSTNLPGFSYRQFASPQGGDLRFAAADGVTPLAFEVDEWNTNGASYVWVQVPFLNGPNDFIWAYWGNPLDTTPPATTASVWAPGHHLVWHLKEGNLPFADSAGQHPATSGTPPSAAAGQIGRGGSFTGSQFLNAEAVDLGNAFTLSAWVKVDAAANDIQTLWANKAGGWNANGFGLFINSYQTTDQMLRLETGDGVGGTAAASAAGAVSYGQWHQITAAVDRSAGRARLYVDGADVTQNGGASASFGSVSNVYLGQVSSGGFRFHGVMDEARIENTARSADWIWAGWMTTASNALMQSYAAVVLSSPALVVTGASSQGFTLSWPGGSAGFELYTATNLNPPVAWVRVTNPPVELDGAWRVTLPFGNDNSRFYRLQSPDKSDGQTNVVAISNAALWRPRFATPAIVALDSSEHRQFRVEVKAPASAAHWRASLANDLQAWDCEVLSAVYATINRGTEPGWQLELCVPTNISPELFDLAIASNETACVQPQSVSVVPDFERNFYLLHITDEQIVNPAHTDASGQYYKGVGTWDAVKWMQEPVNLINPRAAIVTGDQIDYNGALDGWNNWPKWGYTPGGKRTFTREETDSLASRLSDLYLDGHRGFRVPYVETPGNHDVAPVGKLLAGSTLEWHPLAVDIYEARFGQRSWSFRMGDFYVLMHDWSDAALKAWAAKDYQAALDDPTIKYRLIGQHFSQAWDGAPGGSASFTPDKCDLMLIGHGHTTATIQTSPYPIYETRAAFFHGTVGFFNFQRTPGGWSCDQTAAPRDVSKDVWPLYTDFGAVKKVRSNRPDARNVSEHSITITNDLPQNFYDGRVRFVWDRGNYSAVTNGTVLAQYPCHNGEKTAVLVKVNIPARGVITVGVPDSLPGGA